MVGDDRRFGAGHKQLIEMNVTCVPNYNSEGLSRRFKEMEQKVGQWNPRAIKEKLALIGCWRSLINPACLLGWNPITHGPSSHLRKVDGKRQRQHLRLCSSKKKQFEREVVQGRHSSVRKVLIKNLLSWLFIETEHVSSPNSIGTELWLFFRKLFNQALIERKGSFRGPDLGPTQTINSKPSKFALGLHYNFWIPASKVNDLIMRRLTFKCCRTSENEAVVPSTPPLIALPKAK